MENHTKPGNSKQKEKPYFLAFFMSLLCTIIILPHIQSCSSTSHIKQYADTYNNKKEDTTGTDKTVPNKNFIVKTDKNDCEKAPNGMVCIPGGNAIIGASNSDPNAYPGEKSQYKVYIKTFYIDKYEITNRDYNKCVKAGGCKLFKNIRHPMFRNSIKPDQPAVPLTWKKAFDYCKWAGKRLPTEIEWEKVARGGTMGTMYPWGNDKPNCKKANYRPCYKNTSNVGSFKPGHYGVYDMAGNGYEWVNDWATPCRIGCGKRSCGADCLMKNALGPCSGRYPCGKRNKKILKGGSWWWPASHMRGSWRRSQYMWSGGHRLSARCASDTPYLTNAHAWMLSTPPKNLPDPKEPTKDQLKILHKINSDITATKTICHAKYTSPAHCKDPMSYVKSNEARLWYFAKYMKNLGGGYAGVAADANYTFIAHARSRWVWLFDFDKNINALHKIIRAFILKSESPKEFTTRWHPRRLKSSIEILRYYYEKNRDFDLIKFVYLRYKKQLYPHYVYSLKPSRLFGSFGWLRNKNAYRYIRLLYQQNRIAIVPGDMLKNKTIRSISLAAKELGTKIRIYYPSNAEEFWNFNSNYKKNILSLPFDEASITIRTVHEYPWHPRMYGYRFWHYIVHGALNYQKKIALKGFYKMDHFKHYRIFPMKRVDTFSTIELPSSLPKNVKVNLDD